MGGPGRHEERAEAASEGDQKRFDCELAKESNARGAKGRADGKFAAACRATREEEIADVGAGDEQDETDGAEKNSERCSCIAEQVLFERFGVHAPAFVGAGVSGSQAIGDGGKFEFRAGDGSVGLQTREDLIGMIAAFGLLFFARKKRGPEFAVGGKTEGRLRGNDADDGVRLAVEGDGLADGVSIGGKIFFPES